MRPSAPEFPPPKLSAHVRRVPPRVHLAVLAVAVSAGVLSKFCGPAGVAVYAASATGLVVVVAPGLSGVLERLPRWLWWAAALLLLVTLGALLLWLYPLSTGGGNDRADALNVAAARLLRG